MAGLLIAEMRYASRRRGIAGRRFSDSIIFYSVAGQPAGKRAKKRAVRPLREKFPEFSAFPRPVRASTAIHTVAEEDALSVRPSLF
jgi:hypothetical protein